LLQYLKDFLGRTTEPSSVPGIPGLRLVDMYMSCTEPEIKDSIELFFIMDSSLQVVIATTAFVLGIDCFVFTT